MKKNITINKQLFIFLLPTFLILLQFLFVGPLPLSWVLYFIIALYILIHFKSFTAYKSIIIPLIIISIYPLLSMFWSKSRLFESELYFSMITGMIVVIFIFVLNEEEIIYFLKGCLFSCFVFSIWGCFEIFTGVYILFSNPDFLFNLNSFRLHFPGVAFANTNDYAQYLAMISPVVFVYEWEKPGVKAKLQIGVLLLLVFFVVFQSECHLALLCLTISCFYFYLINMFDQNRKDLVLINIVLLLFLGFIFEIKTGFLSKLYSDFLFVDTSKSYYTNRAEIYLNLVKQAINNPFGGFGNSYMITSPHNFFLFFLDDFGFLNTFLLFFFLIDIFVLLLRKRNKKTIQGKIAYGLLMSLVTFPLSSSISSGNEQRKALWILLGVAIRFAFKKTSKTEQIEV